MSPVPAGRPPGDDPPDGAPFVPSFAEALDEAFEATDGEVRVVARHARDLADSGRYRGDTSHALTPSVVVNNLADARHDGLASKWNWWVGSLELAYGDYVEFRIRTVDYE